MPVGRWIGDPEVRVYSVGSTARTCRGIGRWSGGRAGVCGGWFALSEERLGVRGGRTACASITAACALVMIRSRALVGCSGERRRRRVVGLRVGVCGTPEIGLCVQRPIRQGSAATPGGD